MTDIDKKTLGRNDPCHCGSGKKYKACHLEADEAAAREARKAAQDKQEASAPAAEGEAGADAPAAEHAHAPREARHNTSQPWKKSAGGPRSVPRFNAPRRSGGS